MKRKYETPMAYEEVFAVNEHVSACWGVACSIDPANDRDKWNSNVTHRNDHCGKDTNQHIYTDSHGTPISMKEEGTDGLGKLTCQLYANEYYSWKKDIKTVRPGQYIYWTTQASDGRVWHHQGYVKQTYANRPNHS